MGWVLEGGEYRYRSAAGRTWFGIWSTFICFLAGGSIWDSVTNGGWTWLFGAWGFSIAGMGWLTIALEVSVASDGELTFRGLFWKRRWNVAHLRSIGPGNGVAVFKFVSGSVMLASSGGPDLQEIMRYQGVLNPPIE